MERRKSQAAFSIRRLLIFIGVLGVCLVPVRWFVQIRRHVRQSFELEQAFRSHGWDYGYSANWYDEGVSINDNRFGDDQLLLIKESLEGYTAAKFLSFAGTQVTEQGIESLDLSCFRRGIVINVTGTQVSAYGAAKLQQSLPGCRIVHEALQQEREETASGSTF